MKVLFIFVSLLVFFFSSVSSAFASNFTSLEKSELRSLSISDFSTRPIYSGQYKYITKHECKPVGIFPYGGDVLYICENDKFIIADILTPLPSGAELFSIGHKKKDDDVAAFTAAYVPAM